MNNYFKPGSWNVICPVCGVRYKADELRQRWDGQWVCRQDWESRHPQDLIRTPKETSNQLPYTYPPGTEPDVSPTYTIPLEPVPPGTFNNGL
jgi:hypothetical protein